MKSSCIKVEWGKGHLCTVHDNIEKWYKILN